MKTKRLFLFLALTTSLTGWAQDQPLFSSNQSLLFLNPSFAGSNGFIRNQNLFRKNFVFSNVDTYASSVDGYVSKLKAGVALSYLRTDIWAGAIVDNYLAFTYAQHIHFGGIKIVPSVQVAYGDKTHADYWVAGPGHPKGSITRRYMDINSGLLISSKNLYFGATVYHANMPDAGIVVSSRLARVLSMNASYNLPLHENALVNISGRMMLTAGSVTTYDATKYQSAANILLFKHLILGFGGRHEGIDNVAFGTIGLRNNFISAGFSYGRTPYRGLSGNLNQSEFMLSYNLRAKDLRKQIMAFEAW